MKKIDVDCNYVHQNICLHQDDSLDDNNRYFIRQHISECKECREYFEELIYTANLLSNSPSPTPQDGLLDRIKFRLRKYRRPTFFDWVCYPVSRIFSALHLELKPILVNSSAFVLYIIIGLFIAKLVFLFGDSDSIHPTKPIVKPRQRIVTFAEVKSSALSEVILDVGEKAKKLNIDSELEDKNNEDKSKGAVQ